MRSKPWRNRKAAPTAGREPRPGDGSGGPEGRAEALLSRLEAGGPQLLNAAEELDRHQPSLERAAALEPIRDRVRALCEGWADGSAGSDLRGARLEAWLCLTGAFGLSEFAEACSAVVEDPAAPAAGRCRACEVLCRLDRAAALRTLERVLIARSDTRVREAAAQCLGELGDASVRPSLEALLEQDLPQSLWVAVDAARLRLR